MSSAGGDVPVTVAAGSRSQIDAEEAMIEAPCSEPAALDRCGSMGGKRAEASAPSVAASGPSCVGFRPQQLCGLPPPVAVPWCREVMF